MPDFYGNIAVSTPFKGSHPVQTLRFYDEYVAGILIPLVTAYLLFKEKGFKEKVQEGDAPSSFRESALLAMNEADSEIFAEAWRVLETSDDELFDGQGVWQEIEAYKGKIEQFLAEKGIVLAPIKEIYTI